MQESALGSGGGLAGILKGDLKGTSCNAARYRRLKAQREGEAEEVGCLGPLPHLLQGCSCAARVASSTKGGCRHRKGW